jgi:hypothetical protein
LFNIWLPRVTVVTAVYELVPSLAPGFVAFGVYAFFVEEIAVAASATFWHVVG